jgi:hypothetical protein
MLMGFTGTRYILNPHAYDGNICTVCPATEWKSDACTDIMLGHQSVYAKDYQPNTEINIETKKFQTHIYTMKLASIHAYVPEVFIS